MKTKVFRVKISGNVSAVVDMLRYDACWPATEAQSGKLVRILENRAGDGDRVVDFATHQKASPTKGRWESFGHIIVSERL